MKNCPKRRCLNLGQSVNIYLEQQYKITNYGKNQDVSYFNQANKTLRKWKNKDVEIKILKDGEWIVKFAGD